jgi:hypothetical protein
MTFRTALRVVPVSVDRDDEPASAIARLEKIHLFAHVTTPSKFVFSNALYLSQILAAKAPADNSDERLLRLDFDSSPQWLRWRRVKPIRDEGARLVSGFDTISWFALAAKRLAIRRAFCGESLAGRRERALGVSAK